MAQIKNLHLLTDFLSPGDLDKLEQAAVLHRRHAGITFKIAAVVTGGQPTARIQVVQEKHAAENYHQVKRLIEIVHETFDRFMKGWKIVVRPVPYKESPVSKVNQEWINGKMLALSIKLKDISEDTGINYTQLSALVTGNKPLSQPMKALFYFYFSVKEYNNPLTSRKL